MYGGIPEKFRNEGVFAHRQELVKIGDEVEALRNVAGEIRKGARLRIRDILIEPKGGARGFTKRLVFENIEGDFNPKRFRRVSSY